eukprot:4006300-Amphidinium_carterae.1
MALWLNVCGVSENCRVRGEAQSRGASGHAMGVVPSIKIPEGLETSARAPRSKAVGETQTVQPSQHQ